ncbi:MAG TPA: hypothetical protein VHD38_00010 [Candidatus Paceibacterota bacterium]|nr:hypothetical protein [Candidatus Paceibacterota bacterium]
MKKFLVMFCDPNDTIQDWLKNTSEEERAKQTQQMMTDWQAWVEAHKANIVEGRDLPVGKTKRVTSAGVADARNELNYVMVVQAETHDEAAAMFVGHPHLVIPNSYIDISDSSRPTM